MAAAGAAQLPSDPPCPRSVLFPNPAPHSSPSTSPRLVLQPVLLPSPSPLSFAAHCPDVLFMVNSHQLLDGAAAEDEDEEVCGGVKAPRGTRAA